MLLDLTHTSHTRTRTGIQRVALGLERELGAPALPVCHDPYQRAWRPLEAWERANLSAAAATGKRRARWPLRCRLRGLICRRRGQAAFIPSGRSGEGLLLPEIFSPGTAAALPALFAAVTGPRAALFFDAAALKYPEFTPAKTVARYPAYLRELLMFDGIAAISQDARDTLIDYWRWLEVGPAPQVVAIPLGIGIPTTKPSFAKASAGNRKDNGSVVILSVGSLEGRKNHGALLEACEQLWAGGRRFELHLVGLARSETGRAALQRVRALQAAGRPLRYDGFIDDAALEAAYAVCAFTVYPSLMEGFGLPVGESLARGKPCVCSGRGALGESARGGGCLTLGTMDAASLAGAIGHLLADTSDRDRLGAEARARKFKSEADYAREVKDWMASLPRALTST